MTKTNAINDAAPKITDTLAQKIRLNYLDYRKTDDAVPEYHLGYREGRADAIVWLLDELGVEIEKVNEL